VSKFREALIQKINALTWFRHKEEEFNGRKKKIQGMEGAYSLESQKTHPTREFTIAAIAA